MTQRYVLEHAKPRSLRECYVPRTLTEAFGPYARLDIGHPHRRDRSLYVTAAAIAACACLMALAGFVR